MKTYTVRAKRWEHGWELHIDGIGVTQSHGLRDAELMARDLIAIREEVPEDSFSVDIVPEIGEAADVARAARAAVAEAERAQRQAAAQSREAARRLRDEGFTGRDIAAVLGVSPQRVSQLLKEAI